MRAALRGGPLRVRIDFNVRRKEPELGGADELPTALPDIDDFFRDWSDGRPTPAEPDADESELAAAGDPACLGSLALATALALAEPATRQSEKRRTEFGDKFFSCIGPLAEAML